MEGSITNVHTISVACDLDEIEKIRQEYKLLGFDQVSGVLHEFPSNGIRSILIFKRRKNG